MEKLETADRALGTLEDVLKDEQTPGFAVLMRELVTLVQARLAQPDPGEEDEEADRS